MRRTNISPASRGADAFLSDNGSVLRWTQTDANTSADESHDRRLACGALRGRRHARDRETRRLVACFHPCGRG